MRNGFEMQTILSMYPMTKFKLGSSDHAVIITSVLLAVYEYVLEIWSYSSVKLRNMLFQLNYLCLPASFPVTSLDIIKIVFEAW